MRIWLTYSKAKSKSIMKIYLLFILPIFVYGCQDSSNLQTESLDQVEASVITAYNGLCKIYSGTDVEKILDFYTNDIVRIPPSGEIFVGKELLREAKTRTRLQNIYTLDDYSVPVVVASVDQAVTYSTFKDTSISKETGDTIKTEGTWTAVWQKQTDNTWKIRLSTYTGE